ncbi:MAG: hypothetical protein P9M14_15695 [Candidatus Alcyoniella australis]|nr:hypothetical protein [Candidatus Alcyoniella australis]
MRRYTLILALVLCLGLLIAACDEAKDSVNDATKQEKDFSVDFDLPLVDLGGETGICLPAYNFTSLLGELPGWDEVEGHIESVELSVATYEVSDNANSADGVLTFYTGDDGTTLDDLTDESMAFAKTDNISAAQNVAATDLIFLNDGENIINGLLGDLEGVFVVCGQFAPEEATVSMNVKLTFTITVTFVPLD